LKAQQLSFLADKGTKKRTISKALLL
jgi:hypothetical protein